VTDNAGGTYTLLVRLAADARIEFGARGERALPAGWYAYVGSAFGPVDVGPSGDDASRGRSSLFPASTGRSRAVERGTVHNRPDHSRS
jgi:hypothetical protein